MVTPHQTGRQRLIREFLQLKALGLHLYPVGSNKLPIGQWALGDVNYVHQMPSDERGALWSKDPRTNGWAILCGNRRIGVFTLDVESAGMGYSEILAVLASLPMTCQRPSPTGGRHAVIIVTDGEPVPTQVLARVAGVLLAEVRGVSKGDANGAYAVVTGPGRGPLPADFEPAKMTRAEVDELLDVVRTLHRPSAREVRVRDNKGTAAYAGSQASRGSGTGRFIAEAIISGQLAWPQVLDDGWTQTSEQPLEDGLRLGLLRPAYGGVPPTSSESANAVGATLVVHSGSVEWADPGEAFNPQQALAASRFDADYWAAMKVVEASAEAYVTGRGLIPIWISAWPGALLEQIHEGRARSVRRWHAQHHGSSS